MAEEGDKEKRKKIHKKKVFGIIMDKIFEKIIL